jgi:hypothetical protein
MNGSLTVILAQFNAWCWYMAVTGQTTIEFWGAQFLNEHEEVCKFGY